MNVSEKLFSFLFLFLTIFISSCTNNSEDEVLSDQKQILEFSINTVKAKIDETEKTITLTLPYGTDVKSLAPSIQVSNKAQVSPSSGNQVDFTNPVNYTVTAEDGSKTTYKVVVHIEKNNEANILSFKIGILHNIDLDIDQEAKTISYSYPYGTDIKAISPLITVSTGATVKPESKQAQDFTNPVVYTVTAENGNTKEYTVAIMVKAFVTEISSATESLYLGESIFINGKFAASDNTVSLDLNGTITKLEIKNQSQNRIEAVVPANMAVGKYTLNVVSNGASAIYNNKIEVKKHLVEVTTLEKSMSPGQTVTVKGNYFMNDLLTVYIGSAFCSTKVIDAKTLEFIVPASLEAGIKTLELKGVSTTYYTTEVSILNSITKIVPEISPLPIGGTFRIEGVFATSGNNVVVKGFYSHDIITSIVSENRNTIVVSIDDLPNLTVGGLQLSTITVTSNGLNTSTRDGLFSTFASPNVTSVSTTSVKKGGTFSIYGTQLCDAKPKHVLLYKGISQGVFTRVSSTEMTCILNDSLAPGIYDVNIYHHSTGRSYEFKLTVTE